MIVSLRCDCAFFLEKLEIIMCRLWRPECVARQLVKPTKSAISYMPTVTYEIPYENAKEMLLVEEVDNKDFLTGLFDVMYDELPTPKPKKKK